MTEVRIRYEDDTEALSLGDVPLLELDRAIPFINKFGVNYEYDSDFMYGSVSGEFVMDESGAFFEVRLGLPGE